jgi:ABC-type transport system substrate-binding protein
MLVRSLQSLIQRVIGSKVERRALTALVVVGLTLSLINGCTRRSSTSGDAVSASGEGGATLNYALPANLKGLDPVGAEDLYSATVIAQIYEGLLSYHYLRRPMTLQPSLAEAMPEVSKDGLTWTFKIRKGVRFHDNPAFPEGKGREVVAEDFVYSWKRLADPRSLSPGFWILDGKIVGLNEWASAVKAEKADYSTPVEGLKAIDSHTLQVKLTSTYFQLPYVLAMGYTSVVPREAVEKYGKEFLNNPVGTGPFMLKQESDWIRNSKLTLVKNPTWRGESYPSEGEAGDEKAGLLADAGKAMPFVDRVVFTELVEDQPRWQNALKGNFDWLPIPKDNFDAAVDKGTRSLKKEFVDKGLSLNITRNLDVTYIGFQMRDPVLGQHKKLRQAMQLAFDSATNLQKFQNGRGIVAQSPVPPDVASYDPGFKNPYQEFNLDRAKKLLEEAGFPGGKGLPEFTYETLSDTTSRQGAEYIKQQMAAIGINIKISTNTFPELLDKTKKRKAQMWGLAWGADYPDAQNFYQLFYGPNAQEGGPNDTGFNNPEFNRLYQQALKLPDGAERNAVYNKMRDIVVEEAPWIFNLHRERYALVHGWVGNYKHNDVQLDLLKYIRIDAKKREELKAKL